MIVRGRLDAKGKLTVDATLKGVTTEKRLVLTNGAKVFTALNNLGNQANTIEIVRRCISLFGGEDCSCRHALDGAVATSPESVDEETRRTLAPLFDNA